MKRMMSGLILAAISLIPLGGHAAWSPTITEYDRDASGWSNAVNEPCTEDFNDTVLNPGLNKESTHPGHFDVDKGVWWDIIDNETSSITTWTFAAPIYAFGGTWNLYRPGGPGSSIDVLIQGVWVHVGNLSNCLGSGTGGTGISCGNSNAGSIGGEFWGFVSDLPFTAVRLQEPANAPAGWKETYELEDMVYAYAANSPLAQPFTTSGVITTKTGANNDQAIFKLKGVAGIKAAAQAAKASGVVDALTFTVAAVAAPGTPILTLPSPGAIPSSSLTVTDTQLRYTIPLPPAGSGNLDEVRCVFSTEECVVNIKGVDFDPALLNILTSEDTTVSMTVDGTIYTDSGSWTQEDSGSGSWTKYRK